MFGKGLNVEFVSESVEYMVGKEENGGYHHFLLFPQCLVHKLGIVWERVNPHTGCVITWFPKCVSVIQLC